MTGSRRRITAAAGAKARPTAPGAEMRSNSPVMMIPDDSNSVASVAIRTIGSFFG
jgi:hypothetical protein